MLFVFYLFDFNYKALLFIYILYKINIAQISYSHVFGTKMF